MRFYTKPHRYYCGIDLHARRMYICVLDAEGQVCVHRNGPATPEHFLKTIAAYREDLVVAVECIFTVSTRVSPRRPGDGGPCGLGALDLRTTSGQLVRSA